MYMIANLAIGGAWPGSPDQTTSFPAYYDIDYVRAYERAPDAGPVEAGVEDAGMLEGGSDGPPPEAALTDSFGEAAATDAVPEADSPTDGAAADGASTAPDPPAEDDGGCSCRLAESREASRFGAMALLSFGALVAASRRRLRGRRSAGR